MLFIEVGWKHPTLCLYKHFIMKILTKKYDTKIVNNFEFDNFEFEVKIKLPTDIKNFIRNFQNCKVKEILFFDDKKELWVLNSFFSFAEIVDLYKEFLEEYHQGRAIHDYEE